MNPLAIKIIIMVSFLDKEGLAYFYEKVHFQIKAKRPKLINILHGPIKLNKINNEYFLNHIVVKIPANKDTGKNYKYYVDFVKSYNPDTGEKELFPIKYIYELMTDGINGVEVSGFPIKAIKYDPYGKGEPLNNGKNYKIYLDFGNTGLSPKYFSFKVVKIIKKEETETDTSVYIDIYVKEIDIHTPIYNSTGSVSLLNKKRSLTFLPTKNIIESIYSPDMENPMNKLQVYYKKLSRRGNIKNNLRSKSISRYIYRKSIYSTLVGTNKAFKSRNNLYKIRYYSNKMRAKSNLVDAYVGKNKRIKIL